MPRETDYYVEGYSTGREIMDTLHDIITGATGSDYERTNQKWDSVFQVNDEIWVEYEKKQSTTFISGTYKHSDGNNYPVYKLTGFNSLVFLKEQYVIVEGGVPGMVTEKVVGTTTNEKTGRKLQVVEFTIDKDGVEEKVAVSGCLVAKVIELGYPKLVIVKQEKEKSDGTILADPNWNSFIYYADLPKDNNNGDWVEFVGVKSTMLYASRRRYLTTGTLVSQSTSTLWATYKFKENYYTAKSKSMSGNSFVLKVSPAAPPGLTAKDFYLMAKQPAGQYNYLDFYIGKGFNGDSSSGNKDSTYTDICDPTTVGEGTTPTITNQIKAEEQYEIQISATPAYTPPKESWQLTSTGKTDVSGAAHFFFAKKSTIPGSVTYKERDGLWGVKYQVWINNTNIKVVLEGDSSPFPGSAFKSFAYVGRLDSLDADDYNGNFALTVGSAIGELPTGFVATVGASKSISYTDYGTGTANGMWDISMLRTKSNTPYQAHHAAFLTQQPDYKSGTSLPSGVSELVVYDAFQKSAWSGMYYASPAYVVHSTEGHRGSLDGVVAILSNNLLDGDELEVDTGELKDLANPAAGTWKEVYKYVAVNSPISMFTKSANPSNMGIAILTEVR